MNDEPEKTEPSSAELATPEQVAEVKAIVAAPVHENPQGLDYASVDGDPPPETKLKFPIRCKGSRTAM